MIPRIVYENFKVENIKTSVVSCLEETDSETTLVFYSMSKFYTYPNRGISTVCDAESPISENRRSDILFVNVTSGFAAHTPVSTTHAISNKMVSPAVFTFCRISVQSFTKL